MGFEWGGLDAAEFADRLFDGADVADFDAEVFADFDGVAFADGFVVGEEFEFLFSGFSEFHDDADAETHDFTHGHAANAHLYDDGDFDGEKAVKVGVGAGIEPGGGFEGFAEVGGRVPGMGGRGGCWRAEVRFRRRCR